MPILGIIASAFTSVASYIALSRSFAPALDVWPWTSAGYGTRFSDPATPPTGSGDGVVFNPAKTVIAVADSNTPYVLAYPWSSTGFGTKYANPGTLPFNQASSIAFNSTGTVLAVGVYGNAIEAYPWSSGFGTKYSGG